jgi:hypothetical protein
LSQSDTRCKSGIAGSRLTLSTVSDSTRWLAASQAARGGHFAVLQWLHRGGCRWDQVSTASLYLTTVVITKGAAHLLPLE